MVHNVGALHQEQCELESLGLLEMDRDTALPALASTALPQATSCTPSSTRSCRSISDPNADPPKILVIGPDSAGNLLKIIVLVLGDDRLIAMTAMKLRRQFFELLPGEESAKPLPPR